MNKVAHYPEPLKSKIINRFVWDAEFSLQVAKKPALRGEVFFVAGCLTRIASDLVQALYALNETYFISDKGLYTDETKFSLKPKNFPERIDHILGSIGIGSNKLEETLLSVETLVAEVVALCGQQYKPKFKLS